MVNVYGKVSAKRLKVNMISANTNQADPAHGRSRDDGDQGSVPLLQASDSIFTQEDLLILRNLHVHHPHLVQSGWKNINRR